MTNVSPLGSLPGSVIPEGEVVAAHYGRPFAEEHQLRAGRGFTDLSFIEIVTVSGVDRLSWLHNLTTRDFNSLKSGISTEMMILDPNGHIQSVAGVVDDGETTWLLTDVGGAEPLAFFLDSMKFMLRVEVVIRPGLGAIGVMAVPDAIPAAAAELAQVVWHDPWPNTTPGGTNYGISDDEHPARLSNRSIMIVPEEQLGACAEALIAGGMTPVGLLGWEAARIADRRPRASHEVVERALPHELDWLRTAVHLEKGCYRGQETVAKLINLGKPPRRLTYLYLEGPEGELPDPGTEVMLNGKKVGQLTSIARDADEGPIALALLKRSVAVDATLEIGEFVASQEEIVSASGKSAASPAERPGAGLGRRARGTQPTPPVKPVNEANALQDQSATSQDQSEGRPS